MPSQEELDLKFAELVVRNIFKIGTIIRKFKMKIIYFIPLG